MKALTSRYDSKKFLHISRSGEFNLENAKSSRKNLMPLLEGYTVERLLSDCRNVDFVDVRAVDIYVLLKELKDDFPNCRRMALLHKSIPANLLKHYQAGGERYDIEFSAHTELDEAKAWLCMH